MLSANNFLSSYHFLRQGILGHSHRFFLVLLNIQRYTQILIWDLEIMGEILLLKVSTSTSSTCLVSYSKIFHEWTVEFRICWFSLRSDEIAKIFQFSVCHLFVHKLARSARGWVLPVLWGRVGTRAAARTAVAVDGWMQVHSLPRFDRL